MIVYEVTLICDGKPAQVASGIKYPQPCGESLTGSPSDVPGLTRLFALALEQGWTLKNGKCFCKACQENGGAKYGGAK